MKTNTNWRTRSFLLKNRKRFQFALGICYDDEINTAVSQLKEMLGEKFEERIDE